MRNAFVAASATVLAFGCVTAASASGRCETSSNNTDVVILAGQSNALGYQPAQYIKPQYIPTPRVQIWQGDRYVDLMPGVNSGIKSQPKAWGPEVGFAMRWLADHPCGRLEIIKISDGSTGLEKNEHELDWSPLSENEMFARATTQVTRAIRAAPHEARPNYVLWVQGEQDAMSASASAKYKENLDMFIVEARAKWAMPHLSLIIARLPSRSAVTYRATVRKQQQTSGFSTVDTDNIPLNRDSLHYTPEGLIALGGAFYEAWKPLAASGRNALSLAAPAEARAASAQREPTSRSPG